MMIVLANEENTDDEQCGIDDNNQCNTNSYHH